MVGGGGGAVPSRAACVQASMHACEGRRGGALASH